MTRARGRRLRVAHCSDAVNRAERTLAEHAAEGHDVRYARAPLLIGGGLLAGFALTTVRTAFWSRTGGVLLGGAAWLLRSPAGPLLAGALWAKLLDVRHDTPHRTACRPDDAALR